MKTDSSMARVFSDLPLFSALSDTQLARIKKEMRLIKLKENQPLFEAQQAANHFFVLRRGRIKLFRLAANGAEKIIEIVQPGESFATAVMFMEHKTYPVCAQALQESRVLSFANRTFLSILKESPQTCFRVLAEMSKRMRQQITEIDQLSLQCAPSRVATYIIDKLQKTGNDKGQVDFDAPKRVIASRLSIQPETFSRALQTLRKKGVIQVERGTIYVTNPDALKRFAENGNS